MSGLFGIIWTAVGRALAEAATAAAQVTALGFTATATEVNTVCGGVLTGNSVWDPVSIADGAFEAKNITVTGAALGDFVLVGAGIDVVDMLVSATVTAENTVTIVLQNETGGAVDLASSTWNVMVLK